MAKKKAIPVSGYARIVFKISQEVYVIQINQKMYLMKYLAPEKELANPAWRLRKEDGDVIDVAMTPHGLTCTCADFNYRRQYEEKKCKHCCAISAVGLMNPL